MSVARLYTVKKSRKDQKPCGKCGAELPAGTPYLYYYVGFRSNYKYVRCTKADCYPMPSERESSKIAPILAAQENFARNIDSADSPDDIAALVQEVGTAIREVADEYQEALDAWENGNYELEEKASHYESQADEPENWTWGEGDTDYTLCLEHDGREDEVGEEAIQNCDACQENREQWLQECRDAAQEIVDNIEFA